MKTLPKHLAMQLKTALRVKLVSDINKLNNFLHTTQCEEKGFDRLLIDIENYIIKYKEDCKIVDQAVNA